MVDYSTMEKQALLDPEANASTTAPGEPEPTIAELQQEVFAAQRRYMRAWSRTTNGKWQKRIMWGVTAFILLFVFFCGTAIVMDLDDDDDWQMPKRVPLEAHIMSKCPDAKDCLHDLIMPAMMNVSRLVDFKLSYIGKVTDEDDGVLCKHGQQECLGNIIELCAAKLYPDPKMYLGFTMCLTRDYTDIPKQSLVEDCALEHGINFSYINNCVSEEDGDTGVAMLRRSIERSEEANVTKSCTVRLNGKVRCVRDGGKWTDCEGGHEPGDLAADIQALYDASMHRNITETAS